MKNFVQKDFDEMFPKWDGDVDDPAADNIIKVMFNDPGWELTMDVSILLPIMILSFIPLSASWPASA